MRPILVALALGVLPVNEAQAQYWRYPARPPAAYPGRPHGFFYPPGRGWTGPYGRPVAPYGAPGYRGAPVIVISPFGTTGGYPAGGPQAPAQYPQGYAPQGYAPQGYAPQGYAQPGFAPQNGQAPGGH